MPFSSSSLTSVASEKRGGGWVNFCSGRSSLQLETIAFGERRQHAGHAVVVFGVGPPALAAAGSFCSGSPGVRP